jgi:hypothetical protein
MKNPPANADGFSVVSSEAKSAPKLKERVRAVVVVVSSVRPNWLKIRVTPRRLPPQVLPHHL